MMHQTCCKFECKSLYQYCYLQMTSPHSLTRQQDCKSSLSIFKYLQVFCADCGLMVNVMRTEIVVYESNTSACPKFTMKARPLSIFMCSIIQALQFMPPEVSHVPRKNFATQQGKHCLLCVDAAMSYISLAPQSNAPCIMHSFAHFCHMSARSG